jgi:hypothetical protein
VVRGGRLLQAGAGAPYRADLAFDVEVPDTRAWACPGVPDQGPSRVVEVGDARFLASGRDVDAAGAWILPALSASVRGFDAQRWLTVPALEDIARLGVGTLRWHVAARDTGAAQDVARERAGPGRPAIAIVSDAEPRLLLTLGGPPRVPRARTLDQVLDALDAAWRAGGVRPLESLLPLLTGVPAGAGAALAPGAAASFLVLRTGEAAAPDAAGAEVAAVFVDGRELPAPAPRGGPPR